MFDLIGDGWCRPEGCDHNDGACRVNGYVKDGVDSSDCRIACFNETSCTGFATSSPAHSSDPNRCYVHGDISSSVKFSEWRTFQKQYYLPTNSSGASNVECWKRKGVKNISIFFLRNTKFLNVH